MAFKFPLATVLQVRQIREDREERMLQQIQFEINQAKSVLEQVDAALERSNLGRRDVLFKQQQGRDVHGSYGELAALKQNRNEILAHLEKLDGLRLRQVKVLASARADREMLTEMRADQVDTYKLGESKREQKALDDNFGARFGR